MEKRPIHKSTNIIKYIHGWQHVGRQKQQMNVKSDKSKYKMCGELETQHHYMVCKCATARLQRTKAWTTLKRKLQLTHTKPSIIAIIGHVIHQNLEVQEHKLMETDVDDDNLIQSIQEQQKIGWKHMFMGRLSHYWNTTQRIYCHHKSSYVIAGDHHIPRDYNKWRSSFLITLIQYGLDLMEARNNIIHGEKPTEQQFIRQQKAIKRAKAKFTEGEETVCLPQQRLFYNFDRRLEGSVRSIEAWTEMVDLAQAKRREELKDLAKQPDLFTFQFTQTHTHKTQQIVQQVGGSFQPTLQHSIRHNTKCQKRVQQNLRQMLLCPNPPTQMKTIATTTSVSPFLF